MSAQLTTVAMADDSLDAMFEESVQTIQSSMSQEEQDAFCQFPDISSMLEDMRALSAKHKEHHPRLLSCSQKMASFSHAFAPYFDIVNIFVQTKPDWLGWFWGSIRLVFKLGSNYVLFLEKVADMFEHMGRLLPPYHRFYEVCKQQFHETGRDRLTRLMSYLYADIVHFCLQVRRIFARGSRGVQLRHRLSFLATALWKPLDLQFFQLLERLTKHQQWFDREMQVQSFDLLAQHRQEFLNFLKTYGQDNAHSVATQMLQNSKRIDRIKSWLSSYDYRGIYEQARRQRHVSSGSWFLRLPEYCNWKNAPFPECSASDDHGLETNWRERVLFVHAKPGYGKTVLSCQIIDDLTTTAEDSNIGGSPPSIAFYHFSSTCTRQSSSNDALRALAVQLVHAHRNDRPTLDSLSLLFAKTSGQPNASLDDALAVLNLLLMHHSTFIVIDGLDECSDSDVFLNIMWRICQTSDCRILVLSRPNMSLAPSPIWEGMAPLTCFLDESHNTPDIESFLTSSLHSMIEHGYFGSYTDAPTILTWQLGSRANGMFLWATLLVKYLQSPGLTPQERRVTLQQASLLEGLESLYAGILNMLGRRFQREKGIAVDIFRWLSFSVRPLSARALHTALAIIPGQPTSEDQYLLNFPDCISQLTCALVEARNGNICFMHRSVEEYLKSPACQAYEFSLADEFAVHAHLATRCISYLAYDIPKYPLQRVEGSPADSGASIFTSRTANTFDSGYRSMASSSAATTGTRDSEAVSPFDSNFPLLRYASLCWPVHLTRSLSSASTFHQTPHISFNPLPSPPTDDTTPPIIINPINPINPNNLPWLTPLSEFLTSRPSITAWAEASFRYNFPPNISRLIPLLASITPPITPTPPNASPYVVPTMMPTPVVTPPLSSPIAMSARSIRSSSPAETRELKWVIHGLKQLSDALNELREESGTRLLRNPGMIWRSEGRSLRYAGFWPVWDERSQRVLEGG